MKTVKIAALKSALSQHLRDVRRGEVLTVLDRSTPVARLVPVATEEDVAITAPAAGAPAFGKVRLPRAAKLQVDAVSLLLQDRQSRG
jgi:prevent-host-death family protein